MIERLPPPKNLEFCADTIYDGYLTPEEQASLFEKARNWKTAIRNTESAKKGEMVTKEVLQATIRAIFGSNLIEFAGLDRELTFQLCQKVFMGQDVWDADLSGADLAFDPKLAFNPNLALDPQLAFNPNLAEFYRHQPSLRSLPEREVIRARNEVIQHARAFQHLLQEFVGKGRDLDEDLIKESHRILTKGVPILSGPDYPAVAPEDYGGVYRTVVVGAGTTNFAVPQYVPKLMKELCEHLKYDLEAADARNAIDPFSVAAKYSLDFVQIHPFQDGNGRMCRMILNAILYKYAGIIVPIGESAEEREEYMGIKRRSSQEMEGHGEYAAFVLKRGVTRLREMKKKLAGTGRNAPLDSEAKNL